MPHDEFSNFKSAIDWPEPKYEEQGAFKPISVGAMQFVEVMAHAQKLDPICESPIEVMLGSRLAFYRDKWKSLGLPEIKLAAQYKLAGFRYDFAIKDSDGKLLLAIECDGKEFHSSPEQQANDEAKNAAIFATDAAMFRFTGSDIFRDDDRCAAEIFNHLRWKFGISNDQWNRTGA